MTRDDRTDLAKRLGISDPTESCEHCLVPPNGEVICQGTKGWCPTSINRAQGVAMAEAEQRRVDREFCTCDQSITHSDDCPVHSTARALTETYGDPPSPPLGPIPPAGPPPGTGAFARIICETAADLVNGDRNSDYGDALDNFTETAALWSPILGVEVTAEQVALCMNQVKVARLIHNSGHRDSWIDGVGYLALGGGIARRREQS